MCSVMTSYKYRGWFLAYDIIVSLADENTLMICITMVAS